MAGPPNSWEAIQLEPLLYERQPTQLNSVLDCLEIDSIELRGPHLTAYDGISYFFDEILKDLRPVLYHYTTPSGLLGILESEKIRLTDTRFLNDPDEQSHGLQVSQIHLLEKQIDLFKAEKRDLTDFEKEIFKKLSDKLKETVDPIKREPVYSISFCEHGDLLSQWKGYSNYGEGFSIGFEADKLAQLPSIFFGRVIYDDIKKREVIWKIIEAIAEGEKDYQKHGEERFLNAYIAVFNTLAYFMKSIFFSEEREWRLVCNPRPPEIGYKKKHRFGICGVTPYIEIDIAPISEKIADIVVGPRMDCKINLIALSNFIDHNKIRCSSNSIR